MDAPTSNATPAHVGALVSGSAAPEPPPKGSPPKLTRVPGPVCGCSLCDPVVSEDTCTIDADCAPASPCHAEACVAKAKAVPLTPGASCTAILLCNTADANACGCREGRCALYARGK